MKAQMRRTLKELLAGVGQTLKLESSKTFLCGHNSYLQNNHSLSCKTEHMHVMHAKIGSRPFLKKIVLKIKVN